MKVTMTKTIVCQDLDDLVTKTYGRPYNFQQQDGCRERGIEYVTVPSSEDYEDDEIPEEINGDEMGVSFEAWLSRDPKAPVGSRQEDYAIDLFWERNFYPDVSMVMTDLYKRGLIEAGEYLIVIDW